MSSNWAQTKSRENYSRLMVVYMGLPCHNSVAGAFATVESGTIL